MSPDHFISTFDKSLRILAGVTSAHRPNPAGKAVSGQLSDEERRHSAGLMRVNHVGEVCAQALYEGQAITTSDDSLRGFYRRSAQEEADHLAWTRQRLKDLAIEAGGIPATPPSA
jgi:ubiquinone biosynthesis monooxygenase Coq7